MALHVFVAMPRGRKQDIDFDAVYADYLKPALSDAGFEVFRADQEALAGDIPGGLLQKLLLADLVVVDLSIDDPNVWYELGVRHALRARGVLLAQSRREHQPFAIHTDHKLRYRLKDGRPDPDCLEADKTALADMARATMAAWHGRPTSPVHRLLKGLREPDWRDLMPAGDNAFRAACETWQRRIEAARKDNLPGDIMTLVEETPTWALRLEATRAAGKALTKLGRYALALEQVESALALAPDDIGSQRDKGMLLGRLGRFDAAREWADSLIRMRPDAPEDWCLLGRLEKEDWMRRWRLPDAGVPAMYDKAAKEIPQLLQAIEPYMNAFVQEPSHFSCGINACTLRHLQIHLGGKLNNPSSLSNLEGGVVWACLSALERQPQDYRTRAGWAELNVLLYAPDQVETAWREAVAVNDKDWFALDRSRRQLRILRDLGFRPDAVAAALEVLEAEIATLEEPWQPRRIFLFSGHMIDAPDRPTPRFPAAMEARAAQAIAAKLDELGMGPDDLAICGGACGGDTLFAEDALGRGCRLQLFLQFDEPEFLQASVARAGESWVERYFILKDNPRTRTRAQPDVLGPPPTGMNPYARNNLWQLHTALAHGPDKIRCIALWNGEGGDKPGGTEHMVETVKRHAGRVSILDTRQLFGLQPG